MKYHKRLLAFLPAAMLTGLVLATAAGVSLIPAATASDVTVTGKVLATLDIPMTGSGAGCPDGAGLEGTHTDRVTPAKYGVFDGAANMSIPNGWETSAKTSAPCTINFGSTDGTVQLTFVNKEDSDYFFCNHPGGGARSCTAGPDRVGALAAKDSAISTDTFGIALEDTPLNATGGGAALTKDGDGTATAGEAIWAPIPKSSAGPSQLCRSVLTGDAQCTFRLGVQGKGGAPTQASGTYDGVLVLGVDQL